MIIESVTIENFKAVDNATIPLKAGLTVLVGQNSAGKSSVLQAVHWACRCVAHPRVQRNQTRSLAAQEFDYYPTEEVRKVGHNRELRQRRGENPEVSVKVTIAHRANAESDLLCSTIPISQGNNDVIKIDLTNDAVKLDLYELLTDRSIPFTSYIPGLAGIPLNEEKRSRLPVLRQAASGDANTVLRNILCQLSESNDAEKSLARLSELCSMVLGDIEIIVEFEDSEHFLIQAKIRTDAMAETFFAPLELAGTGVLQCIQIFAYLLLYRPKILLIDEPDAHLHPSRQEKLVTVLSDVAQKLGTSVLMTTHSPNVVRALPESANLIWMKNGRVEGEGGEVRRKMGWGVLDKKIILVSEDQEPEELRNIIAQWPDLERQTAIWPVNGHTALPSQDACKALMEMTGIQAIVIHRDGDFMTHDERETLRGKYSAEGIHLWITDLSDVEAYFLDIDLAATNTGISRERLSEIYTDIEQTCNVEFDDKFHEKRQKIAEDRRLYEHRDYSIGVASAREQLLTEVGPFGVVHGKVFSKRLKSRIQDEGGDVDRIFSIPDGFEEVACSLSDILRAALPEAAQ